MRAPSPTNLHKDFVIDNSRPFVMNQGRLVDARYIRPELMEWSDNPLISALPPALDLAEAASRLAQEPKYDRNLRSKPAHIRRVIIQNAMKNLFIPLDIHLDLQQRLQCTIRIGYADRNPCTAHYIAKLESRLSGLDQYGWRGPLRLNNSATSAVGFNILGMSGCGKSRTILNCLHLLPQTISHSSFQGRNFTCKQLVWLKQDCPFDGNPKGLCIDFFNIVDAILGTDYRRNYAGTRRIVDEMLSDMSRVAANHSLGVLVIDEIQRLSLAKSGGADRMLNFFVQLVNTIGVPVILIGTYKAMSLFFGEFSQMRRGTGQGDLIWDRMENDESWRHFVESLWRYQYVRKCSRPGDKNKSGVTLSDVLYEESQGIIDFAIKIFMFAQERAIETGRELIDARLIRRVANDKLMIPRPVLKALKVKDRAVLEQFEDLYPLSMKQYLRDQTVEPRISGAVARSPEIKALINKDASKAA